MVMGLSGEEARTLWAILTEKQRVYEHDLETKYDGDERFDEEDGTFLRNQIEVCEQIRSKMVAMGYKP